MRALIPPAILLLSLLTAGCGNDADDGAADTAASDVAQGGGDATGDAGGDASASDATAADTVATGTCDLSTPAGMPWCVAKAAYLADLELIAKARPPGADHHTAVRAHAVKQLKALGYTVTEQPYGLGTNVVAEKAGTKAKDEIVIVGAHYDGVRDCPAADDNGTGVAGALQAAAALAKGSFERTLQIVLWDEEERGLVGSYMHAAGLAKEGRKVVAMFDFEMIGFRTDDKDTQKLPPGFDVVFAEAGKYWRGNGKAGDFIALIYGPRSGPSAKAFLEGCTKYGVSSVPVELSTEYLESSTFGDLRRSDHTSYWAEQFPAMMITDTANFRNTHYHCNEGQDSVDRLDHDFAVGVVRATVGAAIEMLAADGAKAYAAYVPECDLDKQDCPSGKKCTITGAGSRWAQTCVDVAKDTKKAGELCNRPDNKLGLDDCAAGLFCTPWGVAKTDPVQRRCVKPCSTTATCDKGDVCVVLGRRVYGSGLGPRSAGLCVSKCDPFATDPCGKDLGCGGAFMQTEDLKEVFTCMWKGAKAAGETCSPASYGQCTPGLRCAYGPKGEAPVCQALCDAKHPCKSGTCFTHPGYADKGRGTCWP